MVKEDDIPMKLIKYSSVSSKTQNQSNIEGINIGNSNTLPIPV